MNSAHSAAYLVLVHSQDASKALLFNADHAYLSEVIDDGFIVDNLRNSGSRCPTPRHLSLADVLPASVKLDDADLVCFRLDQAA